MVKRNAKNEDCGPSVLEQGFGTIRRSFMGVVSQYELVTDTVSNTISTGKEHSAFLVDYLRDDPSPLPRIGAITVGGLLGFLLGIRGGKFKKLVYTSTGSLSVAAFIYPAQARNGLDLAKHYTNIGYNFVYGVKPGDSNQLEIHWPELPTSLSEVGDLVVGVGSSAACAVVNLTTKAIDAVKQKEANPKEPASKPKTS
ncbi:MICOS complex subunit MIC27 isoform X2 [Belonocnema kinseyi]|uniref:MICOS complex subunit MIC27 isoform X2 n=1 Tax=Belonocnema kinseyi TaxID=2817044 RepID=UPI00143DAAE0|nr:MICOS complex subunit MIC27 isoform X2 [Belonocnema kinseyi]